MRRILFIAIVGLSCAPAQASTSAHCDATPFTLGKPAAIPWAEAAQPTSKPQAVATANKAKVKVQAKPEPKQRLLANCKSRTKKKS
jgi:hypothetical protein